MSSKSDVKPTSPHEGEGGGSSQCSSCHIFVESRAFKPRGFSRRSAEIIIHKSSIQATLFYSQRTSTMRKAWAGDECEIKTGSLRLGQPTTHVAFIFTTTARSFITHRERRVEQTREKRCPQTSCNLGVLRTLLRLVMRCCHKRKHKRSKEEVMLKSRWRGGFNIWLEVATVTTSLLR